MVFVLASVPVLSFLPSRAGAGTAAQTFAKRHGRLAVNKSFLVDKNKKPVQLKGVSTHGINWDVGYPYVNEAAFKDVRDKFGANAVRLAMYTQDYNGYCTTDDAGRKRLEKIIDRGVKAAKKLGMYAIIDWHVLNDQTPKKYQKEAIAFFRKISKKYSSFDNVLYEICNEPNGGATWSDVKSYAKKAIKAIRKNTNAVIIVGTPTWSQDVDVAAKSPIKGCRNVIYAFHFYAATHGDGLREKVRAAHEEGLPMICTEFAACEASGAGSYDFNSANEWLDMMDGYGIGYMCWSLSNKDESASLLKPSCKKTSGFKKSDLSKAGKWLVKKYRK